MKKLKLKKWIRRVLVGVQLIALMITCSVVDFELSARGIISVLTFPALLMLTSFILCIDDERLWEDLF